MKREFFFHSKLKTIREKKRTHTNRHTYEIHSTQSKEADIVYDCKQFANNQVKKQIEHIRESAIVNQTKKKE